MASARFKELAACRLQPGNERFAETTLVTGVFSFLHVLFGCSIGDVVPKRPIHVDIRWSLLEGHRELGLLLNSAEAVESGELNAMRAACDGLPTFPPSRLAMLALSAATWYEDQVRFLCHL